MNHVGLNESAKVKVQSSRLAHIFQFPLTSNQIPNHCEHLQDIAAICNDIRGSLEILMPITGDILGNKLLQGCLHLDVSLKDI
jgi:hypothetical protein